MCAQNMSFGVHTNKFVDPKFKVAMAKQARILKINQSLKREGTGKLRVNAQGTTKQLMKFKNWMAGHTSAFDPNSSLSKAKYSTIQPEVSSVRGDDLSAKTDGIPKEAIVSEGKVVPPTVQPSKTNGIYIGGQPIDPTSITKQNSQLMSNEPIGHQPSNINPLSPVARPSATAPATDISQKNIGVPPVIKPSDVNPEISSLTESSNNPADDNKSSESGNTGNNSQ